jgi:MFS family permease
LAAVLLGRQLSGNRDFARMWASMSVSLLGDRFTALALPTTAIVVLHAGPVTVGVLAMCGTLPDLLFSMVAGVVADRGSRRRILVACDLVSCAAVVSIPVAAAFGRLQMVQLFVAAAVEGTSSLLSFLTFYALLPPVSGRAALTAANARLESSGAVTRMLGPGLAGVAIQWLGAARAMVFDAASFLVSALLLAGIHHDEAGRRNQPVVSFRSDLAAGARLVFGDRQLRRLALCSATANFASGMGFAVYLLFLYREAHMTPVQVGVVATATAVVVPVITFNTPRIIARAGTAATLLTAVFGFSACWLVLPLATRLSPIGVFALAWGMANLAGSVWNVSMFTLRQAFTPDGAFGRMVAATKTVATGSTPIGSLAGGALGAAIGLRGTLLVAGVIGMASGGFLFDRALLASRADPVAAG